MAGDSTALEGIDPSPQQPNAAPTGGDEPRRRALPRLLRRLRGQAVLLRPVLPLILLFGWWHSRGGVPREATAHVDRSEALVKALEADGLLADAIDVRWLDAPPGTLGAPRARVRALLRARKADEPSDIYLAATRLSPEGRLLDVTGLYNLSDTSAVDERRLIVEGEQAAWVITGGDKTLSVHLADLSGEATPELSAEMAEWGGMKRWQHSITNLQKTGQRSGIGRRSFKLEPPSTKTGLAFSRASSEKGPALLIDADGHAIRIPLTGSDPIDGERFLKEQPHHLAQPGNLVTWAVDRVRQSPWFSDDQMQLLKAVAFAGLDQLQQVMGSVTGDDGSSTIKEQFKDLPPPVEYTDPETGWPPPPMEPMLNPPIEGEGKWRTLDDDPYVRKNPGAPSPFVTSFIRTDRKRAYTQIFVTVWDARQVELHTMSGTLEPKSATGETGPGLVPRKPEVMGRLLAGFNGGFQATHGEFGMMADNVMYLPPKPYAATVAEMKDGTTRFGTWPNDESIPEDIVGFRQNMTPLVMDGVINPYKRNWWGGVPPGWKDESRTTRSAVCLTKENFVAYLYGNSIDADHLAFAMERARCVYGIHLDMNPGHTGLEFYHAAKQGELPDVGHELDKQWEATGEVAEMPGWSFIGRRMLRYMGLMNFPRYISRESRDFFYLTLRHIVPGMPLRTAFPGPDSKEGVWTVKGLPQHGWPYAVATTSLRPDVSRKETKVRVMQLDPRALEPETKRQDDPKLVAVFQGEETAAPTALWLDAAAPGGGRFVVGAEPKADAKSAKPVLIGRGYTPDQVGGKAIVAGACIGAGSGMLYYAEIATAPDPQKDSELLSQMFANLGCSATLLFEKALGVAIGGDRDLAGSPVARHAGGVRLLRKPTPGAGRIFPETPIVPAKEWYPLQAKRVRYFRKPKPAEPAGDEGGSTPEGGGAAPTPAPAPAGE